MHDILNPEQEKAALELAYSIGLYTSPDFLPCEPKTHRKSQTIFTDWRSFLSKPNKPQELPNYSLQLSQRRQAYSRNMVMTSEGFSRRQSNQQKNNQENSVLNTDRAQTAKTNFRTTWHSKNISRKINDTDVKIDQGSRQTKRKKSVLKSLMNSQYKKLEQQESHRKKNGRSFSVKIKFNPKANSFQFCL